MFTAASERPPSGIPLPLEELLVVAVPPLLLLVPVLPLLVVVVPLLPPVLLVVVVVPPLLVVPVVPAEPELDPASSEVGLLLPPDPHWADTTARTATMRIVPPGTRASLWIFDAVATISGGHKQAWCPVET